MKSRLLLLTTVILAVLLVGCAKEPENVEPEAPVEETVLQLESLTVELPRSGRAPQNLLAAVRELPEPLRQALAEQGVEVERIQMTVGSSPSATIQALEEGGVDLAFLPAESVAEQETAVPVILTSGPLFWDQGEALENWNREPASAPLVPGYRALICTAPTEYGRNLAGREAPTWEELDHAHWGVLARDSLLGYRAVDLWLADSYEGNRLSDLSNVTEYEDFESLLQAAAREEIDIFPMQEGLRAEEWADAWMLPESETDQRGEAGLGRTASIWEETPVLALTDWFYDMTAVVSPDNETLTDQRFVEALAEALRVLSRGGLETESGESIGGLTVGVLGTNSYAPAPENALAAMRRLLTME